MSTPPSATFNAFAEIAGARVALLLADREGRREDLFYRVRDVDSESTRGRAAIGVAGREPELNEVFSVERGAPGEQLDADQREREHVGPRSRRAVAARELFGRAVLRREARHAHPRLGERGLQLRVVAHHLGDAEIEDLDGRGAAGVRTEDEQIRRLDVPVSDAFAVRDIERAEQTCTSKPATSATFQGGRPAARSRSMSSSSA